MRAVVARLAAPSVRVFSFFIVRVRDNCARVGRRYLLVAGRGLLADVGNRAALTAGALPLDSWAET
ncbi:MAG: hypothetical protein DMF84_29330 [Acidobacteria bacterium]|nr:MAG: hypothetical protein DMF84_29330 [Acidobacteriota bacterium]